MYDTGLREHMLTKSYASTVRTRQVRDPRCSDIPQGSRRSPRDEEKDDDDDYSPPRRHRHLN